MDRASFDEKLRQLAEEIKAKDDFVVVGHHDADGISAAAIAVKALQRLGKKTQTRIIKQLYPEDIVELKGLAENFLFVDFGSGQLDVLLKEFKENFFVLDHHIPLEGVDYEFHLNPQPYGFSGNNEISGSGLSYLFAKALNEKNVDLSPLAIVGAVGDMQDSRGKLIGLNAEILREAVGHGAMAMERDLHLYGRISRPLLQFIFFSSSPILPDLTANEENCHAFLNGLGIPLKDGERRLSYSELSPEAKRKLTTALLLHMQAHNVPEWKLQELIGEIYTLLDENPKSPLRDAKEFATLCNSCGRHGQAEVALAVCLGDREEKYGQALLLLQEHRTQLRQGIELMQERGVEERDYFYFFDAGDEIKDSLVGIVAGMLYGSGTIEVGKPIIALGRYEAGVVKVSARATRDLVRKGLHLGEILRKICGELGGIASAGGHAIAAGARISEEQKPLFLEKLDLEIQKSYQ
jgi:RecJ-like exonuclease